MGIFRWFILLRIFFLGIRFFKLIFFLTRVFLYFIKYGSFCFFSDYVRIEGKFFFRGDRVKEYIFFVKGYYSLIVRRNVDFFK